MYGYIFITVNTENHKEYIGKFASVRFSAKYLGDKDNPSLKADIEKYGADKFVAKMVRACETKIELEKMYETFIEGYNALSDNKFYNCQQSEEAKPKKTRKKKVVEE